MGSDLSQYAIKGSETDWKDALKGKGKSVVSVKSHLEKKRKLTTEAASGQSSVTNKKNKKKHKGKKEF
jgi:hypothetical protein